MGPDPLINEKGPLLYADFCSINIIHKYMQNQVHDIAIKYMQIKYIKQSPLQINYYFLLLFQTEFELEFVTNYCNQIRLKAFQYVIVAGIVSIISLEQDSQFTGTQINTPTKLTQSYAYCKHTLKNSTKSIYFTRAAHQRKLLLLLEENSEYNIIQK
ncbi:Hypothetical_protein [Hexamita inflata]|uniref:Hypothetical_protein n=1 Tax=Hexamita inflata TaxID=28002 RepID=A0AA86P270_9EUKA|nr:Hypothetical protein HINF_LOCUS18852 [Hexamita inflata]